MEVIAIDPLWHLVDPITVHQAAALIAGFEPTRLRVDSGGKVWFEDYGGHTSTDGVSKAQTAFSALRNAIVAGRLKAILIYDSRPVVDDDNRAVADLAEFSEYLSPGLHNLCERGEEYKEGYFIKELPDWDKTLIDVEEIRQWLLSKGIRTGFFFPNASDAPDYLDPKNPRYTPKLAAAVRAWLAVQDAGGKHPKQALEKWLRTNAAEFGMIDGEGKLNETGINEVAKVANWKPEGGAPKTPSK